MKLSILLPLCLLFVFSSTALAWYPFVASPYSHPFHHARRLPLHSRLWGFSDPFEDIFRDLEPVLNSANDAVHQQEQLLHRLLKEAGIDREGTAEDAGTNDPQSSTSEAGSAESTAAAAAESAAPEQSEDNTKVQTTRRGGSIKPLATDRDEEGLLSWFPTELFHGPSLDISSTDKLYEISLDVPGVKKDDIKLEIETDRHGRQILTVSGERKFDSAASTSKGGDSPSPSGTPGRSSRYGKFVRSLTLPDNVSVEGIEASHQDGVLRISVPKVEVAPPKKTQIPIRSALKEEL